MEGAVPHGSHMDRATFNAALKFTLDLEALARTAGYNLVLISGGECTEHPDIIEFIQQVYEHGLRPMLLTNGLWLADPELKEAILSFRDLMIQVTHDPRFYPRTPPRIADPRITYVDSLTHMIPLGRFAGKSHSDLPTKKAPASFNFRSLVHHYGDVRPAILRMRMNTLTGGMSGHCTPSISYDGSFTTGETRLCHKAGDVFSSADTITRNVLRMGTCNRCGLEDNLDPAHRAAIGI